MNVREGILLGEWHLLADADILRLNSILHYMGKAADVAHQLLYHQAEFEHIVAASGGTQGIKSNLRRYCF